MVKRFSRKGWYRGGDMGTQGQPVVERAAAGGGAGVLGQGDAVDGGVVEAHAVPRGHEARHGRWLLVGALRASPLLAHGAEADAVAEGVEAADDAGEKVVWEVGPRADAALLVTLCGVTMHRQLLEETTSARLRPCKELGSILKKI
jgi:hypothetical protein